MFPASPGNIPEGMATTGSQLALSAIRLTGTAIEMVTRNPAASSTELIMLGTTLRELRAALSATLIDGEAATAIFRAGYEQCRRDCEARNPAECQPAGERAPLRIVSTG